MSTVFLYLYQATGFVPLWPPPSHAFQGTIVKRWEHEGILDAMQERLDRAPETMRIRRQTAEHPFGTPLRPGWARPAFSRARGSTRRGQIEFALPRSGSGGTGL